MIDGRNRVFARHEPTKIVAVGVVHRLVKPADLGVQFAQRGSRGLAVGTELLGGVIEVRQIDPEEVGQPSPRGDRRGLHDPGRRADVRHRAPEMLQRKVAQLVAQIAVELDRPRVAPQRLAAVGVVDRLGRADEIGLRSHAVHGEPDRRSHGPFHVREQVPNLRPLDAVVGRGPHLDLPLLPPVEPVAHDAMRCRQPPGSHVRLHRASHARKTRHERGDLPGRGNRADRGMAATSFSRRPGMLRRISGMAGSNFSLMVAATLAACECQN